MVDWDRVEDLHNRGWDWDRIAEDPKVGYAPPRGVSDAGRALRTLYVKRVRTAGPRNDKPASPRATSKRTDVKPKWTLTRVFMLATPLVGVWFAIALVIPSPVGIFLNAIPELGLILAVCAAVLAYCLLKTDKRWTPVFRGAVAGGVVLGLLLAGVFGIGGVLAGYPTLTAITTPQPNNFHKTSNALWTDTATGHGSGLPVYFFFGSAACPYCSASSWAMMVALHRFGNLTGTYYDTSSSTDVYPNTPEIVLAHATLTSKYIALQVSESTYTGSIQLPGFANAYQQAYYVAYDSTGSIPFVVVGGVYYTVGTLVNPSSLAGYSPQQVASSISTQSGTPWTAIAPAADWLTAYLLKVDGGQPSSLLVGTVLSDYDQIS